VTDYQGSARTGADSVIEALLRCGVNTCFTNPGTSEMHFVASLDAHPEMHSVLCLFEGVAAGAADGYGRMSGRPAVVLVHLGVGLSNSSAYLHNARRAATPIVVIVGDHATYHRQFDAPLTADIEALARPVSDWVARARGPQSAGADAARAVGAALAAPGGIATLALPADAAWSTPGRPAQPVDISDPTCVAPSAIDSAAAALRADSRRALLLGGRALLSDGLRLAGRVAAATGAELLCETFPARLRRGVGEVAVQKLPYFAEQVTDLLKGLDQLVLVGTRSPVSFFAYPGRLSELVPGGCVVTTLSLPHEDSVGALSELAEIVEAPPEPAGVTTATEFATPRARLNQHSIGAAIARNLPAEAIVVDEAITSSNGPYNATVAAAPHDYLALTGGAIGHGMPMAAGAAVACPGRKVVCLLGDGAALYTPQAMWTMARERLDVTIIIFNNAAYAILDIEIQRSGAGSPGAIARSMLDLDKPTLKFTSIAEGMGVDATRVDTVEAFERTFISAMATPGPKLIEVALRIG
jgi:acetolactate synthase-1/2/3 large subunit